MTGEADARDGFFGGGMPGVLGAYVQRRQMSGYGEREARESLRPGGTEGVISAIIGPLATCDSRSPYTARAVRRRQPGCRTVDTDRTIARRANIA